MKDVIKQDRIIEPADTSVNSDAGITFAGQAVNQYEIVPIERLLRFAVVIGLLPKAKFYDEKSKDAKSISNLTTDSKENK